MQTNTFLFMFHDKMIHLFRITSQDIEHDSPIVELRLLLNKTKQNMRDIKIEIIIKPIRTKSGVCMTMRSIK